MCVLRSPGFGRFFPKGKKDGGAPKQSKPSGKNTGKADTKKTSKSETSKKAGGAGGSSGGSSGPGGDGGMPKDFEELVAFLMAPQVIRCSMQLCVASYHSEHER